MMTEVRKKKITFRRHYVFFTVDESGVPFVLASTTHTPVDPDAAVPESRVESELRAYAGVDFREFDADTVYYSLVLEKTIEHKDDSLSTKTFDFIGFYETTNKRGRGVTVSAKDMEEVKKKLYNLSSEISSLSSSIEINQVKDEGVVKDLDRLNDEMRKLEERLAKAEKDLAEVKKPFEYIRLTIWVVTTVGTVAGSLWAVARFLDYI